MNRPRFGSHLSIAGGMYHALEAACGYGMDCVQIFTKNQRQWKVPPLKEEALTQWHQTLQTTGLVENVSHVSYLINLASPTQSLREKSIALMIDELARAAALNIGHVVMHPGSPQDQSPSVGLKKIATALNRIHRKTPGLEVLTCLEVTAGQGSSLGHQFEHLRWIIDHVDAPQRLAVCFDTAHALAAGYDLTSAKGMRDTLKQFDEIIGLDLLRVAHVNDSKTPRHSRVDRHEHLGQGHVALDAIAELVNHRRLRGIPMILETPKGETDAGEDCDAINLKILRDLCR